MCGGGGRGGRGRGGGWGMKLPENPPGKFISRGTKYPDNHCFIHASENCPYEHEHGKISCNNIHKRNRTHNYVEDDNSQEHTHNHFLQFRRGGEGRGGQGRGGEGRGGEERRGEERGGEGRGGGGEGRGGEGRRHIL